jgi:hypothetical protein
VPGIFIFIQPLNDTFQVKPINCHLLITAFNGNDRTLFLVHN